MLMKWNVTRPTKRGKYFNNVKPKRPPMLRHWRDVKLSISFPKTLFRYWSSKALQRGVECCIDEAKLSLSLNLTLVSVDSNLIQRKRANWTIRSLDGSGRGIVARVKRRTDITSSSALKEEDDLYVYTDSSSDHVTSMLLAINRITYFRQDPSTTGETEDRKYTHKLEASDIRVLWNSSNKDVVLGLYDSFKKNQELKRYLSTDALKSILSKKDLDMEKELNTLPVDKEAKSKDGHMSPALSPRMRHPSSGNTMLDQLLQDMSNQYVKYVDERAPSDPQLKGITAINMDDVTDSNWLITLQNAQVVLQGVEQSGYVLASSHLTDIIGCDHEPKMKNGVYVSKKSWVAKIQDLQYFTTQSVKEDLEYVPWLSPSVITLPFMGKAGKDHSKREADREANLNALLGTLGPSQQSEKKRYVPFGEAAGGTVGSIKMNDLEDSLEGVAEASDTIQLQRVAPRCHCQIIYVTYGDQVEAEINRAASPAHSASPPRPNTLSGSGDVDTFTFRYPSVEVHTTSFQYSLIMDIINNLLLHKESKKKDEVLSRHKFGLQLSSKVKDPRKAVLLQQNKVKKCVMTLRDAETKYFMEQKTERNPEKLKKLEEVLATSKEDLLQNRLKLSVLVRTFRQSQLYRASSSGSGTLTSEPMRRIEIWVDDTHWTLTHNDGQLPLADICFTNFSYNRMTFTDDSGEHRLELGTFKVRNLMPNISQVYQQVLTPYDPNEKHLRVDKNVTLRVYCKDKAPVAGISVKEHLEVNVVPLTVRLTSRFYQTMQDFFFPKAEDLSDIPDADHSLLFGTMGSEASQLGDSTDGNSLGLSRGSSLRRSTLSMSPSISSSRSNYSPPPSSSVNDLRKLDDVDKMKDRANKTKTFIYVKIPQITVCVTYKSENVSIKDLQNQRVTMPTLEYHNRNWTWTDMLMEVKRDYKMAIVGQTIKSVIGMKGSSDEASGLGSPKLGRNPDIIFGRHSPTTQSKSIKSKRLFSKKGSKDGDDISIKSEGKTPSSPSKTKYQPPLTDADITLKRSPRTLTKQSQSLDYSA